MNKEIGIRELASLVADAPKRDVIVNANELKVYDTDSSDHKFKLGSLSGIVFDSDITDYAADQLYGYIGPGFITYGRELAKSHQIDLINTNLQTRMSDSQARLLIRGLGESERAMTRAILSDKYRIMDTGPVLNEIVPLLHERTDFMPLHGGRSSTIDYMKYVERRPSFSIRDANGFEREFSVGFVFSNSEVGAGATMFEMFITDHYCMNGCIFSKKILAQARFTHRGSTLRSDVNGLIDRQIDQVREAAILDGIREAALTAASKVGKQKIRELIEGSMRPIDQRKDLIIEHIGKKLNLQDHLVKKVANEFYDDGNKSPFGIQAALTKAAKSSTSLDERLSLERAGGEVLGYSEGFWKALEAMD
jgi:hypothetical protein